MGIETGKAISPELLQEAFHGSLQTKGLPDPTFAVLIPMVCGRDGIYLLLEIRAAGITQAGDPCFPGGKIEQGETAEQAALRETAEELALELTPSSLIGQIPTVQTPFGLQSCVFVAAVEESAADDIQPNPSEVAEVLRIPLSFFLSRRGNTSFNFDGHVIWGMTAGAIHLLCEAWESGMADFTAS